MAGSDKVKIKSLAEVAVATARARMGLPKPAHHPEKEEQMQKPRSHTRPTSMKRKLLASLAKTAGASTARGDDSDVRYPTVEVEDFWRNLRSWDLCNDLQVYVKQQLPVAKNDCPSLTSQQLPTPLPDSYDSYSEYVNAWAPLCLQEARAQLLSEIFSDLQQQQQHKKNLFYISVLGEPLRIDVGSYTDYVRLQFKLPKEEQPQHLRQNSMNDINTISFKPNDLVLIVRNSKALNQILSASRNERAMGLIGTCENFKSGTAEGLVVKVSRKLWAAKYSSEESTSSDLSSYQQYQELYLVPLKAKNVTSLREFQALCRVKDVPLLPILLAGKEDGQFNTSSENEIRRKNKAELLEEMGGVNALGKGFASYAEKKFNESQLEAVSAASKDYGKGGFTLVKGPPG
jgi:senataxin